MAASSPAIPGLVQNRACGVGWTGLLTGEREGMDLFDAAFAARRIAVEGMDGVAVVEAVAKKRGCIVKGRRGAGELDLEKAAMILLTDYRSGKLGRISLETPESRAAMLAASEQTGKSPTLR